MGARTSQLRKAGLILCLMVIPATGLTQQAADLKGRVFDAATKTGIENLEVKLTPPRESKAAIRLTRTDRNGEFVVPQLAPGRYLLEVSQGMYLLSRLQTEAPRKTPLEIPLTRKP